MAEPYQPTEIQRRLWVDQGRRVATGRHAKGLTQDGLAAEIGVSPESVKKWEQGLRYPGIDHRRLLAARLDIPLAELSADRDDCACCGRPWRRGH
jgi:transcriptional regulator with XRE-family HTH domain